MIYLLFYVIIGTIFTHSCMFFDDKLYPSYRTNDSVDMFFDVTLWPIKIICMIFSYLKPNPIQTYIKFIKRLSNGSK